MEIEIIKNRCRNEEFEIRALWKRSTFINFVKIVKIIEVKILNNCFSLCKSWKSRKITDQKIGKFKSKTCLTDKEINFWLSLTRFIEANFSKISILEFQITDPFNSIYFNATPNPMPFWPLVKQPSYNHSMWS